MVAEPSVIVPDADAPVSMLTLPVVLLPVCKFKLPVRASSMPTLIGMLPEVVVRVWVARLIAVTCC